MSDINTLTGWDTEKILQIQDVTGEKIDELSETLFWNPEAVLNDLKEHHVKNEENAEMMWHKWKKVHINLPAVGNFEWFKFDFFISKDSLSKEDFENNPEFQNKSFSMNEICNLLYAMNNYLYELWIPYDGDDIDYYDLLRIGDPWNLFARDYFNEISGLFHPYEYDNIMYWLRDKNGESGIWLDCDFNFNDFRWHCNLLLKIND